MSDLFAVLLHAYVCARVPAFIMRVLPVVMFCVVIHMYFKVYMYIKSLSKLILINQPIFRNQRESNKSECLCLYGQK